MKGYVHNSDQSFHLNGLAISGVQSLNANYQIPTEDNNFLGYIGPADLLQNAPGVARFSFDRAMITSDEPITELIAAETGFDGGIEYNSQYINFQSGFIDSYQCSFAVDSLAESNVSISAYGEVGPDVVIKRNTQKQNELFIPSSSGISIDFDGRETNRVVSFAFEMNADHKPVYKIGSIFPCEVVLGTPIKQKFSIEMEVDDYKSRNVYDYMRTGIHFETIKVTLKNQCGSQERVQYIFRDAHLLSQDFSTNSENDTSINLSYSTVSRDKPEISYI